MEEELELRKKLYDELEVNYKTANEELAQLRAANEILTLESQETVIETISCQIFRNGDFIDCVVEG